MQRSIPDSEPSTPRCERHQSRHRMRFTLKIFKGLSKQQHPTTFGVDGALGRENPEAGQAALAISELLGMLLRKPSREHDATGFLGYWLVGQWAPGQHGHPHAFQQFACFGVSEVEGLVAGDSNWQACTLRC